ncbi:hypothetical protein KY332_01580 [Candidatus Woesearchaeota archaeon]|nr:hypothetical protein [Candidatus Woesearchaeota archaeon]
MNKTIITQAIVMILLILSLPIAYAATTFEMTKYSGDKDVNGYFEEYDRWFLVANAEVDGDSEITPNQVKINKEFPFQECTRTAGNLFTCTYTGEYYTLPISTYPATFTLHSDTGVVLKTVEKDMTIDNLAPEITLTGDVVQDLQEVIIPLKVTDRANENEFTRCSGISRIEFLDGSRLLHEIIIDSPEQCIFSNTTIVSLSYSDTILIKAYDRMGFVASETITGFIHDNNPPIILPNSFELLKDGIPIGNSAPGEPFKAVIKIKIEDDTVQNLEARADLSDIGAGSDITTTDCIEDGFYITCTWSDVNVDISAGKTAHLFFHATDAYGNQAAPALVTRDFNIDTDAPEITFIGTDYAFEGKSYIGDKPVDIIVKLTETGSGISSSQISLYLSLINPDYGNDVKADRCDQAGSTWTCRWHNLTTTKSHGSSLSVFIVTARDNAGNIATGTTSANIIVDTQDPIIDSVEWVAFEETQRPEGVAVSHDSLAVVVQGTDEAGIRAIGNFSGVYDHIDADELPATECTKTGNEFQCYWNIPSIKSGYVNTTMDIKILDSAGNFDTADKSIEIFALEDDEYPDYWTVDSVNIQPSKGIDTQLAMIVEPRVYAVVDLSTDSEAEIVDISIRECTGDDYETFVEGEGIFNNGRGTTNPYLVFQFDDADYPIKDSPLKFNCTIELVSLYNNQLSYIEEEIIEIAVPLYSNRLGEASSEIKEKIKKSKDEFIDSWWADIDKWRNYMGLAEQICDAILALQDLEVIIGTVKLAVDDIGAPGKAVSIAACMTEEFVGETKEGMYGEVTKFCKFWNCRLSPDPEKEKGAWGVVGGWQETGNWILNLCGGDIANRWFGGAKDKAKDPNEYLNAKDNLFVAVATLCIPGILAAAERYRQIGCRHIICLKGSANTGVSTHACDELKHYEICKYLVGELFNACPITAVFSNIINSVKQALSEPLTVIGVSIEAVCLYLCATNRKRNAACRIYELLIMGIELYEDVVGILEPDNYIYTAGEDYCKTAEKLLK